MMTDARPTTSERSRRSRVRAGLGWAAALLVVAGVFAPFVRTGSLPQRASGGSDRAVAGAKGDEHGQDARVTGDGRGVRDAGDAGAGGRVAPATVSKLSEQDKMRALGAITRVHRPLRDYLRRYGEFPVGTNAEITRALTGANPGRVVFVVHAESPMNAAGELVDAWGTPFFFHQISGRQMEIMSAGPDRAMWTADDVKVPCN